MNCPQPLLLSQTLPAIVPSLGGGTLSVLPGPDESRSSYRQRMMDVLRAWRAPLPEPAYAVVACEAPPSKN